ncbi:carboxylate--amine ligase [Demequina aurantiaca]|uniref:carboxylate--amine ligase n=1 Tax=Demequina aurantiaca TaxID=676200 RepID=UPI003D347783
MKQVLLLGLGGDIGVYAFQRAAHQKYGWKPVVLSKVRTTFLKHSTLAEWIIEPNLQDPDVLVARLNEIAGAHPDHELILFTNLDWNVRTIAQQRDRIDSRWLQPLCDLATFDRVSSKTAFASICDQVDVRTPFTVAVGFTGADAVPAEASGGADSVPTVSPAVALQSIRDRGLDYPLIGKPAISADWFNVAFPGKQKIHHFESEAELVEVLDHLVERSYGSEFLVQEFVPGDETHMRSLTAYRDREGQVTLLAGGQVLLEEHTPGTLGIPAAILTEVDEEAFASARRILVKADYYGFANFDYKISSRDGGRVFFEVNPRIGRNNFYVTAAGVNVAQAVARDLLPDHFEAQEAKPAESAASVPTGPILYSVVPYRLLMRYIKEPALRERVAAAKKRSGVFHPLVYSGDRSLVRRVYIKALNARMAQHFRKYYPEPTDTGF